MGVRCSVRGVKCRTPGLVQLILAEQLDQPAPLVAARSQRAAGEPVDRTLAVGPGSFRHQAVISQNGTSATLRH